MCSASMLAQLAASRHLTGPASNLKEHLRRLRVVAPCAVTVCGLGR